MMRNRGGGANHPAVSEVVQLMEERFGAVRKFEQRQDLTAYEPHLVIDIAQGEYIALDLQKNVESLAFANWLPDPLVTRLTLEVTGNGFTLDSRFAKWPSTPALSSGVDVIEIVSPDGGATVFGRVSSQYPNETNLQAGAVVLGTPELTVHTE